MNTGQRWSTGVPMTTCTGALMAAEQQTVDLAAWLTRIWDEEERLAKAAFSSQEDPENGWGEDGRAVTPHVGVIHEDVQRAHVVRWHPGTVLTRIAADRKILEDYLKAVEDSRPSGNPTLWGKEARFGLWIAVQHLASPYKGREGWREEWE